MTKRYITLDEILGRNNEELTALKQGEFESEKLGVIPFTAISHDEYKQIKKDCIKYVPDGTGGMEPDLDDDKLMVGSLLQRLTRTRAATSLLRTSGCWKSWV